MPQGSAAESRILGTKLTDTIMVLRVDPAAASASVLSFPRDLLVDIPGHTSRSRINSAFETGGPDLLVRTIAENFGIPVHHYLEIDFAGFQELVEHRRRRAGVVPPPDPLPLVGRAGDPRRRLLDARAPPGPGLRPGAEGLPGPGRRR